MLWLGLEGRKKIKALETEQTELRETLERYIRACKQLETEWIDTLDRVNHFMGRAVARRSRAEKRGEPELTVEYDPELAGRDPISQQIIRDRRRTPWGTNGSQ